MCGSGPAAVFRLQNVSGPNKMLQMRTPLLIWTFAIFNLTALFADEACQVTNVFQLRLAGLQQSPANNSFRLEGDVWWANPAANQLVLHDASGAEKLEMDLQGQPVQAGQKVRVEGTGTIAHTANGFRLGVIGPVVDNNGTHAMIEKSGAVYLPAGRQPLRVDWFNGINQFGLEVDWQGPDRPREKIPASALFQQPANGEAGLNFSVYDVPGEMLPDFGGMPAIQSGVVANFDLNVLPHTEHIGVRFTGALDVPRAGLYTFFAKSDDGSQLFVGAPTLRLEVTGRAEFPAPRKIVPGEILSGTPDCQWAQVEGAVTFAGRRADGWELEINSGAGSLRVEVTAGGDWPSGSLLNERIRATGVCQSVLTADGQKIAGRLLVFGARQIELLETNQNAPEISGTNSLPWLTTGAEVHRLKREEAQRGYPVKIRGVVTSILPEHQAFTIQDSTRGLYAEDWSETRSAPPQIGDFLEIEGATDPSWFAPIVKAARLTILGAGKPPEPARPTWDQLLNGSLDAQYIELQGIITAVATNGVTLLTPEGRINLELRANGLKPETLANYQDALVRIRGCLFASWDYLTHEVKAGEIRINGAAISVDQPVPEDLFALPGKTVMDLLRFDPQASVFQRVKVSGQVVHTRNPEFYLTDGRNALRFIARQPADLQAGDQVDVVGFPDLGGAAPLLREAVVRTTGRAPLPAAQLLSADNLARADSDATLVKVRGLLVSVRETPAERILEIQSGVRTFAARLAGAHFLSNRRPWGVCSN